MHSNQLELENSYKIRHIEKFITLISAMYRTFLIKKIGIIVITLINSMPAG